MEAFEIFYYMFNISVKIRIALLRILSGCYFSLRLPNYIEQVCKMVTRLATKYFLEKPNHRFAFMYLCLDNVNMY